MKAALSASAKKAAQMPKRHAAANAEAQALLKKQKEEVEFGAKVLRHIAKSESRETTPPAK